MNKHAFYRHYGRQLAMRQVAVEGAEQVKTAEVNEDFQAGIYDIQTHLEYHDRREKIAEYRGRLQAYAEIINAIESEGSEKVASDLSGALQKGAGFGDFPQPDSDEEFAQFQDQMVLGYADTLAAVNGINANDEVVLKVAAANVAPLFD